jgi:hypothetical protein
MDGRRERNTERRAPENKFGEPNTLAGHGGDDLKRGLKRKAEEVDARAETGRGQSGRAKELVDAPERAPTERAGDVTAGLLYRRPANDDTLVEDLDVFDHALGSGGAAFDRNAVTGQHRAGLRGCENGRPHR